MLTTLIARMMPIVMVMAVLSAPLMAQESREAAIRDVIADQMEDFRADDFVGAFAHASPNIRGIFGTPDNFGMMVRRGYPMVWRPDSFDFHALREEAGRLRQRVSVVDAEGRTYLLDYDMIETGEGWKIDGVSLIPAPEVSA